jgi:hypothetical protein
MVGGTVLVEETVFAGGCAPSAGVVAVGGATGWLFTDSGVVDFAALVDATTAVVAAAVLVAIGLGETEVGAPNLLDSVFAA